MPEHPSIPTATYRLQFNRQFTFRQAMEIVPYLARLGISHMYCSPYFKAGPDSPHGYDISDHNELNPALGTRQDYDALVSELHRHGLRQIADFVPNHMGIAGKVNGWWVDVLENGPSSPYAAYFDIDWRPVKDELENKVLLPILGDQYGRVLERGEIRLGYEAGAFCIRYYGSRLPLAPGTYTRILQRALQRLNERYLQDFYPELQSILTAIDYLPPRLESDPVKLEERQREKEIIKRRLDRLCSDCPQVLEAIEQVMREMEGTPGDSRSFDALDELLNAQPYRISYWRAASEEINYRRFFDINELAAIRMELPAVFEAAHRLIFELIESGAIDGLRIDHVDGLWDPREYLANLQARHAGLFRLKETQCGLYLLVEKILMHGEHLRTDWAVHGTTGYDFANQLVRVLVDRGAEKSLTDTYSKFIGGAVRFDDLVYQKKQLTNRVSLASEINMLGHMLNRLSERNRWYRDFTLNALITAVREVVACFPVYRTYLAPGQPTSDEDVEVIRRAVAAAKKRNPALERSIFDFLQEILLMKFPENIDEETREEHVRFVMKFQQCTGPVMAKGLEDTAFYVYNRLTALNEVGGEPQQFGSTLETFHEQNAHRAQEYPNSMLATSTHDTKRSEDVRVRLAAISEIPQTWRKAVQRWRLSNRKYKRDVDYSPAPDSNEEYLLYQTLAGSWPLEEAGAADETYISRIQDYMTKAIKEAKVNSSWVQPNEAWDDAVREFVARVLNRKRNRSFFDAFLPVAEQITQIGAINGLAQVVLKSTLPGVPDIYQGCEVWDFSLVDPDNRRPVDYAHRQRLLESIETDAAPAELLANWRDGRIKLFTTTKALLLRREFPELFMRGDYQPLQAVGAFRENCIAFSRRAGERELLVIVPRLSARVGIPPIGDLWTDTAIETGRPGRWRDGFTGETRDLSARVNLAEALDVLPFAVFVR